MNMLVLIVVALVLLAIFAVRSEHRRNLRRLHELAPGDSKVFVVWPVLDTENITRHVNAATAMVNNSSNPHTLVIGTNSLVFSAALNNHWQTCGFSPLSANIRADGTHAKTKEAARAFIMKDLFAGEDFVLHTDPLYLRFLPGWDTDLRTVGGIVSFVPQPDAPAEFGPPNPETLTTHEPHEELFVDTPWVCSMFLFAPAEMLVPDLHDPWQGDDIKATSWQWSIKLAQCPVIRAPTRQIVQGPLMANGPCNKRRLQAALGRLACDICGNQQNMHTTEYALGHDYTLVPEEHNLPDLKYATTFHTTGL